MSIIKDALEYALNSFEHLHNTQTYQGDNQDFSDEIITMRAAIAELEQSTAVEPAQSISVNELSNIIRQIDGNNRLGAGELAEKILEQVQLSKKSAQAVPVAWLRPDKCHVDFHKHPGYLPLYTAPLAIDDETRSMVLELCSAVQEHVSVWTYPYGKQTLALAKQIREKLEEGE